MKKKTLKKKTDMLLGAGNKVGGKTWFMSCPYDAVSGEAIHLIIVCMYGLLR